MTLEESREQALAMDRARAMLMQMAAAGVVTSADVARLRGEFAGRDIVAREEADAMFALECAVAEKCEAWTEFFVATIAQYVVWQERPTGVINETQGEWLLARADEAQSVNALAALVGVLAEAHRAPAWFLAAVRARAASGWPGVREAIALAA